MFKNIQLFSTIQAELSIVFGFRIALTRWLVELQRKVF